MEDIPPFGIEESLRAAKAKAICDEAKKIAVEMWAERTGGAASVDAELGYIALCEKQS